MESISINKTFQFLNIVFKWTSFTFSYVLAFCILCVSCQSHLPGESLHVSANEIEGHIVTPEIKPTTIEGISILQIPGYFVWGGTVIEGEDGKYHMLFSLWESDLPDGSFTKNWVLESKIGYAVSDFPDRGFKFEKIVLKGQRYHGDTLAWDAQSVHNPHIKRFENSYYLYYTGSKDPGIQPVGSTGEGLDKRSRVQQSQCVGVVKFDSFADLIAGKFERGDQPLLSPRTRVKRNNIVNGSVAGIIALPDNIIVVNPSVTFNPETKKYMLFFKGNLYEPNWKGAHGVALGDTPTGPFYPKDEFMFDISLPDGSIASTEDPYVWYSSAYNSFFAVVKDFSGRLSGEKGSLALLYASDGIEWKLADQPLFMRRELKLSKDSVIETHNLERPQLLLDERGIPQVLYAACSLMNMGPRNDGCTFNVQISLNTN